MPIPQIYLDHAATTPVDPEVLSAMLPYFSEKYGNPESRHFKGKEALMAVDSARETVAKILNCHAEEIIFCGSGTEANNLAIFGTARANSSKGKRLITSQIEHSSVLEPFKKLEKEGFSVTTIKPDEEGLIDEKDVEKSLTKDTILVSIMHANNQIGTIQPIKKIADICQKSNILFHTDACQSLLSEDIDTKELGIDLMTLNGSKIYGPKGVGALYVKRGTKIEPILFGGTHEKGLRAGTLNVPGIVGFAKALELGQQNKAKENIRQTKLRNKLIDEILKNIQGSHLNGHRVIRLPNNINIAFEGINAHELLLHLDEHGIFASTSSACNEGSSKTSHVLRAICLIHELAESSIRLTIGKETTEKDIDYTIETLIKIVPKLRNKSMNH